MVDTMLDAATAPDEHYGASASSQVFSSQHADYILATALDIYGRRMATVSGDRTVRLWELQSDGTSWHVAAAWQAHRSAVTAVTWAHPEFGSLLATAGADQDVKIWEELSHSTQSNAAAAATTTTASNTTIGASNHPNSNTISRWNLTASLTDARRSVTCVEFAPRQWGLKVATGSSDGCVRIYEAVDIMNLSQWPIAATISAFGVVDADVTATTTTVGCTSLSWCTGRFDPPTLAVGGSHVIIYRYADAARAWQPVLSIPFDASTDILDVAWAPNVGRRFHALAMVTSQAMVRFMELSRSSSSTSGSTDEPASSHNAMAAPHILGQQDVAVPAWRCQWNVTGTVLAVSGDAGLVQLYKRDGDGHYYDVAKIQGDPSQLALAVSRV